MTTYTAITTRTGRDMADRIADALERMSPAPTGVGAVELDEARDTWEISAYFTRRPDEAGLALLEVLYPGGGFIVSKVPDKDWVSEVQRGLAPVAVGRFFIYGRHDERRLPPNAVGLRIEAATAFGTGHHGTTLGCLEALQWLDRQGLCARRVADVGCGTAVLAMAATRLWNARGAAGDIDPVAVATARHNLQVNGDARRVLLCTAPGFLHPILRSAAPYDLIFANILALPLKRLAPQIATHTALGGAVILSGLLHRHVPGVLAVYRPHGFVHERTFRVGAWSTLLLRRRHRGPATA